MAVNTDHSKKHKQITAIVAGVAMTAVMGVALLAIGVNALFNVRAVEAQSVPAATDSVTAQTDVQQLQELVAQYQAREQQYQQELNQAAQQVEQYQAILGALQNQGIIRISPDGQIFVGRGFSRGDDDHFSGGSFDNDF